jgi:hypothetical protein
MEIRLLNWLLARRQKEDKNIFKLILLLSILIKFKMKLNSTNRKGVSASKQNLPDTKQPTNLTKPNPSSENISKTGRDQKPKPEKNEVFNSVVQYSNLIEPIFAINKNPHG